MTIDESCEMECGMMDDDNIKNLEETKNDLVSTLGNFHAVLNNSSSVDTKLAAILTIILSGFDDLKQYIDDRLSKTAPQQDEKPNLIDVETAAKTFSVCAQTIRNLYGRNQIKRYKIGRRVLVDAIELGNKIKASEKN